MDLDSMVIKVKYENQTRRFRVQIQYEELDHALQEVKEKIVSLFGLSAERLNLTYFDRDGDVVALVNVDDLLDAVEQGLNPLRVNVECHASQLRPEERKSRLDYEFYIVFGAVLIPAYAFCATVVYKLLKAKK